MSCKRHGCSISRAGQLEQQERAFTIVPSGGATPEKKPADAEKTSPAPKNTETPKDPETLSRLWEALGVKDQAAAYKAVEAFHAAVKLAAGKIDLKDAGPGPVRILLARQGFYRRKDGAPALLACS